MRKIRSFEQNTIEQFEIEQEFEQIMQIEGLTLNKDTHKEPFPSIKSLFSPNNPVSIIGHGPNANIRAFYYLLLCHIRKVHLSQLLNDHKQRQVDELNQQDQGFRRDRKVSFNGRGAVFLNGPQYQNYALHKLRIYAFSKDINLQLIQNSPFECDPAYKLNDIHLSSLQMKKVLSQFLKQLLPQKLPQDYKRTLKSVRASLNQYKIINIILTIVLRNILYTNYQLQSAKNYECQLNDHTVCTTLCDAFAIDGLLCKDNLYQINTWCKVFSIQYQHDHVLFVTLFNDQFQKNSHNQGDQQKQGKEENDIQKTTFEQKNQFPSLMSEKQSINLQETERKGSFAKESAQQQQTKKQQSQSIASSQKKSQNQPSKQSQKPSEVQSDSFMDDDVDSEIPDSSENESQRSQVVSQKNQSQASNQSQEQTTNLSQFRQTFNMRPQNLNKTIQEQDQIKEQENNSNQTKRSIQPQQNQIAIEKTTKKSLGLESETSVPTTSTLFGSEIPKIQNFMPVKQIIIEKQTIEHVKERPFTHQVSSKFIEQLTFSKPKMRAFTKKKQAPISNNVINNNINNNIYVTLGDSSQYKPVINISTQQDPKCININLK